MKYPISGQNTVTLDYAATITGQALMGRNLTSGRTFWLRGVNVWTASTGTILSLQDATVGTAYSATRAVAFIEAASGSPTLVTYPAPGLKFSTGVCISRIATTVSSEFAVGTVGGIGYEEQ